MLALWHAKPNAGGGAQHWRSEASDLLRDVRRWWANDSRASGAALAQPALPTTLDIVLFLLKTMMRGFKSNSMVSWKPFIALSLGLLRID